MKTFAIVPVKGFKESKSRLSPYLSKAERIELSKSMLDDVLSALNTVPTILISPEKFEPRVKPREHYVLVQKGDKGLDGAVKQANKFAVKMGANSTLFVPGDMPLINAKDIQSVLRMGESKEAIITKSTDGGTGILFRKPPDIMESRFTLNSFEDHIREAKNQKIEIFILESLNLAHDIDTFEDLQLFMKHGEGTKTFEYLKDKCF